jgi:uncharacterized protein YqgV (UPF0045/DUF77 family)
MHVSVDISLYPLTPDYEEPIKFFIQRLNEAEGIEVATNPLTTQLTGDYDRVMTLLTAAMRPTLAGDPICSFVLKILNVRVVPGERVEI